MPTPTKRTPPPNPMSSAFADMDKSDAQPAWKKGDRVRYTVATVHADGKTHDTLLGTVLEDSHPEKRVKVQWDDELLDGVGKPVKHWDPDVDNPRPEHLKPVV